MKKYLTRLALRELQEFNDHWQGYHPGTWKPVSQYASRCFARHKMFWAMASLFEKDDDLED